MQIPYTPAQRLYYGVARIRPVALNALEGMYPPNLQRACLSTFRA
jgi:hypothetical protein